MFTRELGFEITTRCPLRCTHCIVDSGPSRKEEAVSRIGIWLGDGGLNGVDVLVATGGEPFLYPRALAQMAALARQHSSLFRVVTSGSWARTLAKANAMLAEVPVDHLVVSFDRYHREFLPFDSALNALQAGLRRNIHVTLSVSAPAAELEAALAEVTTELQAARVNDAARIEVTGQPIMKAGRALDTPEHALYPWRYFDSCEMVTKHVVKTNGDVIACCGPPAYRTERPIQWLSLGNLDESPLDVIKQRAQRSLLLRALQLFGPAFLYELAGDSAEGLETHFDTRCSLCIAVLSDDQVMLRILRGLERPEVRRRLALAAAMVGDLSLLNQDLGYTTMGEIP